MDTVRKTKAADQLEVGDWLAPGELLVGAAEVLYTLTFPVKGRQDVQLIVREQGQVRPVADVVLAGSLYDLAADDELAALRQRAARAQKIADLRATVEFLSERPWLPLPDVHVHVHLQNDVVGNYRTVRELAEREGIKLDTSLDDRTVLNIKTPGLYYAAIAWHKDGRPVEPEPVDGGQLVDETSAETPGRQFCRTGIHPCIPAVTLTFRNGAGRLHWCAEHAADADAYRANADEAADRRTCVDPGDQEHDHATCEDVLAEDGEREGLVWDREDPS